MFTPCGSWADVALYLVHNYPNLVTEKNTIYNDLVTALQVLAAKPTAFKVEVSLDFGNESSIHVSRFLLQTCV